MNNKLTYKIKEVLSKNEYKEVIIRNKINGDDVKINNSNIKFRYEPKTDKGYLSFGNSEEITVCEIEDKGINEVVLDDDSLSIETNEKSYYCYISKDKLYY